MDLLLILSIPAFIGIVILWAMDKGRRSALTEESRLPREALLRLQYDMPVERLYEAMDRYLPPPMSKRSPVAPTAVVGAADSARKVFFKAGEPQSLEEYDGQSHVVGYLQDAVNGMEPDELALDPQLFLGLPGMGKTLLAKVLAADLQRRAEILGITTGPFLDVFPADIPDVAALDAVMRRAQQEPGTVVFIDEVHELEGSHCTKLYLVLEEGRYQFRDEPQPVKLPPTTLIGATTDYGKLHPALKRRWVKHFLEPATPEQLIGYVQRRPFPTVPAAAELIVTRTKFSGAPWEALEVYRMAVTAAKGRRATTVDVQDVERVFMLQRMDELGLRFLDRRVIEVLFGQPKYRREGAEKAFVCYGASELNVCTLAGLDKGEYRESVRPRLMSRGLLQVMPSYGQALTGKAAELYAHLHPAV